MFIFAYSQTARLYEYHTRLAALEQLYGAKTQPLNEIVILSLVFISTMRYIRNISQPRLIRCFGVSLFHQHYEGMPQLQNGGPNFQAYVVQELESVQSCW